MSRDLPLCASAAWWSHAWLRGDVTLAEVTAVLELHSPVHTVALAGAGEATARVRTARGDEGVGVGWLLETFAAAGVRGTACALPVPGDLFGVAGPGDLNRAALEAGEVLLGIGDRPGDVVIAAVPVTVGSGTQWFLHTAAPRPPADLGDADRALRVAIPAAADRLAALDVRRWSPDTVDGLLNLDRPARHPAPPGVPERALALAARADLVLEIVDVALADGTGGAISAAEAMLREDALVDLARTARHALVAACSSDAWPARD